MKVIVFCTFLLFGAFLNLGAHNYHVSIVDIHYNEQNRSLEIATKLFVDDLEYAYEKQGKYLYLNTDKEKDSANYFIHKYLQDHIQIALDGMNKEFTFFGKEYDDHIVWCYLEIKNVGSFSEMEVTNTNFFELFDDQSHMIHIEKGEQKETIILKRAKPSGKVQF